eukprot:scaffold954_cov28-Phaeocystis_antarctica.AAC.1
MATRSTLAAARYSGRGSCSCSRNGHALDPCRCEERATVDGRARFIDSVTARVEILEIEP